VYSILDQKSVILEKTGAPDASYEEFCALFPPTDCRYGVYDYDYTDSEGCQKSKIVFFAWSPDTAKVRSKMIYAASKDSFRKELEGIHFEIQATDESEIDISEIKNKC